jgi:uncharacterized protein (DUF427 family)
MTHTATWNGKVIARSAETREADGYRYFPRESVKMDLLRISPRTAKDLQCPHGVQFFDLVEGGKISSRAAWSYEAPQRRLKPVDRWIGFWEDVSVA